MVATPTQRRCRALRAAPVLGQVAGRCHAAGLVAGAENAEQATVQKRLAHRRTDVARCTADGVGAGLCGLAAEMARRVLAVVGGQPRSGRAGRRITVSRLVAAPPGQLARCLGGDWPDDAAVCRGAPALQSFIRCGRRGRRTGLWVDFSFQRTHQPGYRSAWCSQCAAPAATELSVARGMTAT